MDTADVLDLFRNEVVDTVQPYLWSETEALGYLDETQKTLVRALGGIPDSTSSLTTVALTVNMESFPYDERILRIKAAYRTSDGRPVQIVNYENMDALGWRFDGRTGPIRGIVIGADDDNIMTYPVLSVADTLRLVIDRLPLYDVEEIDDDLEVKPVHHRHLVIGMKALAYGKQDAETFDKTKKDQFTAEFAAYCEQARAEKERRKARVRVVQYGGLPMSVRSDDTYRQP